MEDGRPSILLAAPPPLILPLLVHVNSSSDLSARGDKSMDPLSAGDHDGVLSRALAVARHAHGDARAYAFAAEPRAAPDGPAPRREHSYRGRGGAGRAAGESPSRASAVSVPPEGGVPTDGLPPSPEPSYAPAPPHPKVGSLRGGGGLDTRRIVRGSTYEACNIWGGRKGVSFRLPFVAPRAVARLRALAPLSEARRSF